MGKILDAFANDELCINLTREKLSPQRRKLLKQCKELMTKLEEKLDNEEKELLTCLVNTILDEGYLYAQDRFIRGYRLGALMTMEIFSEQDTYFCGKEDELDV